MNAARVLAALEAYNADRLAQWWAKCSPKQRAFHSSTHPRHLLRAANQVGKSVAGAGETWAHATGEHPWKEVPRCSLIWVVVADLENHYPTICRKLREVEPGHALDPAVSYTEEKGYRLRGTRKIKVRRADGGTCLIEFRSGRGEVTALASGTVDAIWIDEPPQRSHWSEALSRVARSRGPVWATLTPVGRPVGWLRLHVEGDASKGIAPAEDWEQTVIQLTVKDCPYLTEDDIASQVAGYLPDEVLQRTTGAWEGVTTERIFSNWSERYIFRHPVGSSAVDTLMPLVGELDIEAISVGLGGDHGEQRAGASYWLLAAYHEETASVWCLDEFANQRALSEEELAQAMLSLVEANGLPADAVDRAVGDTNTPGPGRTTRRFNQVLQRAIGVACGGRLPFRIVDASKGPGSVRHGVTCINRAMGAGRFMVSDRCPMLIEACRHWLGPGATKTKELKDRVDAARYLTVSPGFLLDRFRVHTGREVRGH